MTEQTTDFTPNEPQRLPWDLLGVGALIWAGLFGAATVFLEIALH